MKQLHYIILLLLLPLHSMLMAQTTEWTAVVRIADVETGVVLDSVCITESALLSPEEMQQRFHPKQMNDSVNLYICGEQPLGTLATDNVHNTYLGFDCKSGEYAIYFSMAADAVEWYMTDLLTNVKVSMSNTTVYQFSNAASSHRHRFHITTRRGATTDVAQTDAMPSAGIVYTIMGQCVGDMSVWDVLPHGIYIVDGRKMMK